MGSEPVKSAERALDVLELLARRGSGLSHAGIAAALRPHAGIGQDQAHRTLSTAINAIHLSFHADVRADGWLLYHHESTFAGDGMTHAECRVHTEAGQLVGSFAVDAMVGTVGRALRG